MPAPAPAPKGGGNILTRKIGPLPGWAWAAVAVGGYLIYRQRKAAQAASTTAATTSTASPQPAYTGAGAGGAPSGYGYQGPGFGSGGTGPIPTGAVAATAGTPTAPNAPAYSQVATPQEGAALQSSGVPIYVGGFQGLPNTYVPFQSGVQYPTGTSEYVQQ